MTAYILLHNLILQKLFLPEENRYNQNDIVEFTFWMVTDDPL